KGIMGCSQGENDWPGIKWALIYGGGPGRGGGCEPRGRRWGGRGHGGWRGRRPLGGGGAGRGARTPSRRGRGPGCSYPLSGEATTEFVRIVEDAVGSCCTIMEAVAACLQAGNRARTGDFWSGNECANRHKAMLGAG